MKDVGAFGNYVQISTYYHPFFRETDFGQFNIFLYRTKYYVAERRD
jgi:hypothetical protein